MEKKLMFYVEGSLNYVFKYLCSSAKCLFVYLVNIFQRVSQKQHKIATRPLLSCHYSVG